MTKKTMLIDGAHTEELRIVLMNEDKLEEFEFESAHKDINRGNIYVGEVTRVEPSLQAAFISYGGNRNGFLAFNEVHPSYYTLPEAEKTQLLDEFNNQADDDEENTEDLVNPADLDAGENNSDDDSSPDGEKIAAGADLQEIKKTPTRNSFKTKRPQRRSRRNTENTQQQDSNNLDDALMADARARVEADAKAVGDELSPEEIEENARALALANAVTTKEVPEEETKPRRNNRKATSKKAFDNKKPEKEEETNKESEQEPAKSTSTPPQPRKRIVAVHRRYKMDQVLKPGQKVLVQINKEERGNKGAALTTYISLPGRYTVLMPNTPYAGGISRKITDVKDRRTLKKTIEKLKIPNGMGLIVRTAGMGQSEEDITQDVKQLRESWDKLSKNWEKEDVATLVHEDGNLIVRAMRDMLTDDVDQIVIAGKKPYKLAKDYLKLMMPEKAKLVKEHRASQPIFAHHGIEMELHLLDRTRVNLPSGGYLIINPTEALVSVDVNSGRATQEKNIENTALSTNIEAAHELARQLRLRDLAGLIVVDFIDMEDRRNDRKVERAMKEALRKDRARSQVGNISDFGLLEMSRQRLHPSLGESNYNVCPHCQGKGMIRSPESAATIILRGLEEENICSKADRIVITASTQVAVYMLNYKRDMISALENTYKIRIIVQDDSKFIAPDHRLDLIRVSGDGTEKSQTIERSFREDLDDNNKKRKRKRRGKTSDEPNKQSKHVEKNPKKDSETTHSDKKEGVGNNKKRTSSRRDARPVKIASSEKQENTKQTKSSAETKSEEIKTTPKKVAAPTPTKASQPETTNLKPKPKPVTKPLEVETISVAESSAAKANKGKKKSVLQRWWNK